MGKMTVSLVESNCAKKLYHQTSQQSGEHSCSSFKRIHAQISVQRLVTQNEDFVVFLSPFSANARRYLKRGHNCFCSHPFQFVIHWPSYYSGLPTLL